MKRYRLLMIVLGLGIGMCMLVKNAKASDTVLNEAVVIQDDGCGLVNSTVVNFNQMIRSDKSEIEAQAGPVGVSIAAGDYDISLTTYDDHSEKQNQEQTREEWYVIFRAGETVVTTSGTIPDLPDDQNSMTVQVNNRLSIPQDVDNVIAYHAAYPDADIHSVIPVCIGLTKVEEPKASIGDLVWLDSNQNGLQDDGELGIPNVLVHLLDSAGQTIASAVTNGNGRYTFAELQPGDYAIKVDLPIDYRVTVQNSGDDGVDSDIDGNGRMPITSLQADEHDMSWDAGLYLEQRTINVVGTTFCDANQDGIQNEGDSSLSNVGVFLLNSDNVIIANLTTNVDGHFHFDNLVAGSYDVRFEPPVGHVLAGVHTSSYAIGSTLDELNWTAGFSGPCAAPPEAAIGDLVWLDANQNGIQDAGESGVAGITVHLLDNAGQSVASTATNGNGRYTFTNLQPGDYSIKVDPPADYKVTVQNGGDDGLDSDIDGNGRMAITTLEPGETDLTWDAGLYQQKEPACTRFDLEMGRNVETGAGIAGRYEMIEVGSGKQLATWNADSWWVDGGWIYDIELSYDASWVEVFFYPLGEGPAIKLEIVNFAPDTEYGWLASGMCHAMEIQFPADWIYVQQDSMENTDVQVVETAVTETTPIIEETVVNENPTKNVSVFSTNIISFATSFRYGIQSL